jgi:transcriptional regulator with XRE-family HTH domain
VARRPSWPTAAWPTSATTAAGHRRRYRDDRGWSLHELADRAGLHKTYLGQIERGERNPLSLVLFQIAGAFGFDQAVLVRGMRRPRDADAEQDCC